MNIFVSWSKLNSLKIITIKPKTLKVERNDQRFVEYQRYCCDSRINAKKCKMTVKKLCKKVQAEMTVKKL